MSFPPYASYKDSGVEWLGEIPSSWDVKRLRFVAALNPSRNEVAELPDDVELSFIPMEAVGEEGELDLSRTRPLGEVRTGYSYFANGDVVFAKVTPCFENGKGALMRDLVGAKGFGTTELTVLRPTTLEDGSFLWWLTKAPEFRGPASGEMIGAGGLKRVPDDFVANFAAPWPSATDRQSIADFLDRETAKIDALVEAQRRLIALLKEKRQAIISHAVTKGLDPSAPLKPSGIPWLGDIPAHWEVKPIRHLCLHLEQGWSPQCENYPVDNTSQWGVLKVGCVNEGFFRPSENKLLPEDLDGRPDLSVHCGDLLISRANTLELVGSAAFVDCDYANLMISDKIYRLRFPSLCLSQFIAFALGTKGARGEIELDATGASSSMQNIAQSTILSLPVAIPPPDEIESINSALEEFLMRVKSQSAASQLAAALLTERRGALISAAVTGKIDVRGLVAQPETAEAA